MPVPLALFTKEAWLFPKESTRNAGRLQCCGVHYRFFKNTRPKSSAAVLSGCSREYEPFLRLIGVMESLCSGAAQKFSHHLQPMNRHSLLNSSFSHHWNSASHMFCDNILMELFHTNISLRGVVHNLYVCVCVCVCWKSSTIACNQAFGVFLNS